MAQTVNNPMTSGTTNLFASGGIDFLQNEGMLLEYGFGLEYKAYAQMKQLTGGGKVLWTSDPYGKYKVKRETSNYRNAVITVRAVDGIKLKLTFQDTNFSGHRISERVYDQLTGRSGRIVERGTGFAIIEPEDINSVFLAAEFAVATNISFTGVISEIFASKGTEQTHPVYTDEAYYCGVLREGVVRSRRDLTQLQWVVAKDGTRLFSYTDDQERAYKKLIQNKVSLFWTGKNVLSQTETGNWKAEPMGIDHAIEEKGQVTKMLGLPTRAQFEEAIFNAASITGGVGSTIRVVAPTRMHQHISSLYSDFTMFSGKWNTFGVGNGIDLTQWEQSGIKIEMMGSAWHDNIYAHQQVSTIPAFANGTIASNTFYVMNDVLTTDIATSTATKRIQEIVWRSPDVDNSTGDYIAKVIPGMVNGYGNRMTGQGIGNGIETAATDIDGDSFQMIYDGGHFIDATGWHKFVPAV